MTIRNETPSDIDTITAVTRAAFENHPISQGTEQFIIAALREAGALTLSLVAEIDGQVVGHVALSPVAISDGSPDWYGLGPISVLPAHQRQGVGKALMREALSRLRSRGAAGCVLVGDPAYYEQFGFRSFSGLTHEGVPQQFVLALPFGEHVPHGAVTFHKAFKATC